MSFNQFNLDSSITKAVAVCGYTKPTPIQVKSIPEIMNGNDIVACAQTGTGKTAAFVLPALHRIRTQNPIRKPRVLILTPTRELASQITQAAGKYGKFLRFHMASLVGGMSYRHQLRDLSRSADIIVATPGRLLDHLENRRVDLTGIEMLVLDEADRMLDMGFIDDVTTIAKFTPQHRQTLLFSATIDGKLNQIIRQLLKEPIHIDLSGEKISPAQIKQEIYMSDSPSHKNRLLEHLLANENIFKAIIFSATKIGADQLAGELSELGYAAAPLHGDLKQNVRNRTVEQLRKNKIQFIVATDVAARGIDIPDMTHVINYDLPRFCEDYIHRIGRTGRAGKEGIAISFALHKDQRHIDRIERYIGQKIQRSVIEGLEPSGKPSKSGKSSKKNFGKSFSKSKKSFKSDKHESRDFSAKNRFESSSKSNKKGKSRFSDESSSPRFSDKNRTDSSARSNSRGKSRFSDESSSPGFSDKNRSDSSARSNSRGKGRFGDESTSPRFSDKNRSDSSGRSNSRGKGRFGDESTSPRFSDKNRSDSSGRSNSRGKGRFSDESSSPRFSDKTRSDSSGRSNSRGKGRFSDESSSPIFSDKNRSDSSGRSNSRGKSRFRDEEGSTDQSNIKGKRRFGEEQFVPRNNNGEDRRRSSRKKEEEPKRFKSDGKPRFNRDDKFNSPSKKPSKKVVRKFKGSKKSD